MTKKVDEITLGSYRRKANMASAGAAMGAHFGNPEDKAKHQDTIRRREAGLARADARYDKFKQQQADKAKADRDAADQADRKNLPALMKQYQELVSKFKALGGDSYQYADRMTDRDREAQDLHRQVNVLQARINKAGGKLSEGVGEGDTLKNSLHTIIRVATHLDKALDRNDNFPEWVSEKVGATRELMVGVMDYIISSQEMQKDPDAMAESNMKEWKKGVKAPVKPRNFVAKNASTGGAGAHKDKKKAQKQGQTKHKKKPELAETATYDRRLNVLFEMKKLTEQIKKTNK